MAGDTTMLGRLVRWAAPSDPATRELQRDQLMLAVRAAERGRPALALAIVCIGASALQWHGPVLVGTWAAVSLAATVIAGRISRRVIASEHDLVAFPRMITLHLGASLLGIVAIAAAGPLFWVAGDPVNHVFLLMMLTAAASTSILAQAPFAPGYALHGLLLATSAALCFSEGTLTYVSIGAVVLGMSGILMAVGASINEAAASMLKLRQKERTLVDQLREANRAKSEFLANMSHELRTPLNAVIGFSDVMRQQILGPIGTPAYIGYASDIHISGTHLLSLINDILDLSKIEAGHFVLCESEVDLGALVAEAQRIVAIRAKEGGVTILNHVPAGIVLRADEKALKQVALNVAVNAVKFTAPGGEVHVRVGPHGDDAFVLSVSDSGCGIAPADLERVFDMFGQGRHDVAVRERGTGLGLPIVRSLMRAHGGEAWLESEVGTGTTIHLALPLARVLRRPSQQDRIAA